MLLKGINDDFETIKEISEIIKRINPVIAYISIPTRPPAYSEVKPPDIEKLNRAWQIFTEQGIKTELLIGFEGTNTGFTGNAYDDILNITAVHPLQEDSIHELLNKNHQDFSIVENLLSQKLIKRVEYNGKTFYVRNYFNHNEEY